MPYFLVQLKNSVRRGIIDGENAADAVFNYDRELLGEYQEQEILACDDSINTYCEKLLTEYEVTELHRHDVLEWVERRLDGDVTIEISL